jgi:hypothetical protein
MQHFNSYRGRSHTKKHHSNCKQKITTEERKKRKQQKRIAKLFPIWQQFLPCCNNKVIPVIVRTAGKSRTHSRLTAHDSRL